MKSLSIADDFIHSSSPLLLPEMNSLILCIHPAADLFLSRSIAAECLFLASGTAVWFPPPCRFAQNLHLNYLPSRQLQLARDHV